MNTNNLRRKYNAAVQGSHMQRRSRRVTMSGEVRGEKRFGRGTAVVIAAAGLSLFAVATLIARTRAADLDTTPAPAPAPAASPVVTIEQPAAQPAPQLPQEPSTQPVERRRVQPVTLDDEGRVLAENLRRLWTRDPEQLVATVQSAYRAHELDSTVPLTLLLSIAHAETSGKILTVSEAGAVGLAQATPVAYLSEGFTGKLFVTRGYVEGMRAYIMKKSLNDADTVASLALESMHGVADPLVTQLLHAAFKCRRDGVEELTVLEPYGGAELLDAIERADRHNLETLHELERLIHSAASRDEVLRFRDRVRAEYRQLRDFQRVSWKQYQRELTAKRDSLLSDRYGSAEIAKRDYPYEAAEYLAAELDGRFSPTEMAAFLRRHLGTKADEARELGTDASRLQLMTAGLYNGGGHNVRRMLTGLIVSLPETENYMVKVPRTKAILDSALSEAALTAPEPVTSTAMDAAVIIQANP